MLQLWHHRETIKRHNIQVYIVTFDQRELASEYDSESKWNWPILLDRERKTYKKYTKGRASLAALAGPISMFKYLNLLWKGQRLQKGGEDYFQLGGDILIDTEKTIRLHHVSQNPHDRPKVKKVLEDLFPNHGNQTA